VTSEERPIRIGISACLLGQQVRYDGGHKRDGFLADTLGRYVEWVPVCPEVEAGMGTPREAVRLVGGPGALRMVGAASGTDHTEAMERYAHRRVEALAAVDLSGYVLKKDSPSCGMERVKVYGGHGMPSRQGRGLFAGALLARLPDLPVEEEGRLSDPHLRENFIERVFAYHRLRELFAGRWTLAALVRFHTRHKLVLMAHAPRAYQALGRVVAGAKSLSRQDVAARYPAEFMAALRVMATPRRHTNVLMHMVGYFKRTLDTASRDELLATIEDYRTGLVPLIVPLTLVRHHVRRHAIAYLADQIYLAPHPKELMLRNHV